MKRRGGLMAGALLLIASAACGWEGNAGRGERLSRTDPATAAQCPSGGDVRHSGLDDDDDGVLDDDEIDDSEVRCGPAEVSRGIPVPAGERCPTGGTELQTGPDRNGNGMLDDDEVQHRELQCNPLRLTRTVPVPEGEHCLAGGEAHQAGPDRDRDGTLDDDEVDETQYQCSTVLTHDAVIRTSAEAAAFAEITEVQGSLTIGDRNVADLVSATLPQLRKVTGQLGLGFDLQLTSVSLPALTEVGSLGIGAYYGNSALQSSQLPALSHVHGALSVYRSSASALSFPALQSIDGDLRIESSSVLQSFTAPLLRRVSGAVKIESNERLQLLTLTLDEPTLDVTAEHNSRLAELSLTIPEAPTIDVYYNLALTKLTLADPGSESRAGKLGTIKINSNPALTHTRITAERIGSISSYDASAAQQTRIVTDRIEGNLLILDASGTLFFERRQSSTVVIDGDVQLRGSLGSLQIPSYGLRIGGDLTIEGTGITELRHIDAIGGDLRLLWMAHLSVVDPISFVGGGINIVDADELASINFINQPVIFGSVGIGGCYKLEKLPFLDNLQTIHGYLSLSAGPWLKKLISPLSSVSSLLLNGSFDQIQLDNITQLGTLSLHSDYDLVQLSMPSLQTLNYLSLYHNDDLEQLNLPALQSLSRVYAEFNGSLSRCSLQALCARFSLTGGNCDVWNNGPCD